MTTRLIAYLGFLLLYPGLALAQSVSLNQTPVLPDQAVSIMSALGMEAYAGIAAGVYFTLCQIVSHWDARVEEDFWPKWFLPIKKVMTGNYGKAANPGAQ